MVKAHPATFQSVTDVLVHRDKKDIGLPVALFLSFVGHFVLFIVLSVFQGFGWFQREHESFSLGDGMAVTTIELPSSALNPTAPDAPTFDIPPAPEPEPLELDAVDPLAVDIPDFDAEVEFEPPKPPEPEPEKKPEPEPEPTPTPKVAKAAPPKASPSPAKPPSRPSQPTRGSLGLSNVGLGVGGSGGQTGPPADPGLAFYAQRITSLIGEVWNQPYVNAPSGTEIETIVYFAISRDGRVSDIAVERSSGIPNMDQSSVRAVMNAGRLPPLPPTLRKDELTVSFSFRYTAGQ